MRGPREERRRMLALRGVERMNGFNVNCKDCFYHAVTSSGLNVCYSPRMIVFCGGELYVIEDINQNVDCMFFEELSDNRRINRA